MVSLTALLVLGGGALGLFVIVLVVFLVLANRGGGSGKAADDDLSINLMALPEDPIPAGGNSLEFYGTPVRLMVLVIAPAGRGAPPERTELPQIAEHLLPGLMPILSTHQPIFRLWPAQLSTTGFGHVFFNNLRLPGDRGKGTPWCGVVGRFAIDGRPFLAGFVCKADKPNGLGEVYIEHEGGWLDVLRIRSAT